MTRPRRPEPATVVRSTECASAARRATGEAAAPSDAAWLSAAASRAAGSFSASVESATAPPASIRPITWPTVTVSPSLARISLIVPPVGAGSSTSTLSVEISTIVWPALTRSPTATVQARIVPSLIDSPAFGVTMSTIVGGVGSGRAAGVGSTVATGSEPFVGTISASTAPTLTLSPSAACTFTSVPEAGATTSASTLSVEMSTIVSSAATRSPSALRHPRTVPSATESPIFGMTTWIVVSTAITCTLAWRSPGAGLLAGARAAALLAHELGAPEERPDPAEHRNSDRDP